MYPKLEAALEAVNATLDVIIPDMSEAIQQSGNVTDTIVAVRGGGIMGANKDEGLLTTWPFILGIKKTEMCRNVAYPVFRPLALRLCAR